MILLLFSLGILGGFLSGLLGIGGALIIIPLMLSIPQVFGLDPLCMKTVAGLSMWQVFFSSLSGLIIHHKNNFVHFNTLALIGIPMGIFSFVGAYISKFIDDTLLLLIFEVLLSLTLIILLRQKRSSTSDNSATVTIQKKPFRSLITGISIGTISGMVGAGGGFILVPVMISFLQIPVKVTIGTSLGIVFISSLMGGLGKIVSLQTDVIMAVPLILGSIISAIFGAKISKHLPSNILHKILIAVVLASGIQVLFRFFK
jgi:uncharacterized membrane protein YfcA